MRAAVGTLAWLERTGGILSRRDRVDFLGQAVAYGFATLPGELRRALRIGRQVPAVDLGLICRQIKQQLTCCRRRSSQL